MKENYQDKIKKIASSIKEADYVLIGAGAGLSASAGLLYSGDRFENNFKDFIQKYNLSDMYSSGFYPFKTQEEKWAYWSRHIQINRYDKLESDVYLNLLELLKKKEYFVLTTNVDCIFYRSGFDKNKIFATQGDYGKLQCSVPCHNKLYDNEHLVKQMIQKQQNCKIPSNLIPVCPKCGSAMEVNVRKDSLFIEDENWDKEYKNYNNFTSNLSDKKIVLLELGVGYNTPSIIKYPFENICFKNDKALLVRINLQYSEASLENIDKTVALNEDIAKVISDVLSV